MKESTGRNENLESYVKDWTDLTRKCWSACGYVIDDMYSYIFTVLLLAPANKMLTNGGAYNPIVVFITAINGDLVTFLFNIGRIPFQVFGSIVGVRLVLETFPEIWRGPELIINLHQGALTEGLLTFTQVLITL
ncbi:hypothetical protein SSX86_032246, partial [Deinandra increscens subsp. villosa]